MEEVLAGSGQLKLRFAVAGRKGKSIDNMLVQIMGENIITNKKKETLKINSCKNITIDVAGCEEITVNVADSRQFDINIANCENYSIHTGTVMNNRLLK